MCRGGIGAPRNSGSGNAAERAIAEQQERESGPMKTPRNGTVLDRDRLRKLLAMLGSDQDGEVLNAARLIDASIKASGASWQALIPDGPEPLRVPNMADLDRLDQLLACDRVADILKIRLRDMRLALKRGQLADADRRLLRILHRKAVIDGVIVEG
jgi:hypothetical protein